MFKRIKREISQYKEYLSLSTEQDIRAVIDARFSENPNENLIISPKKGGINCDSFKNLIIPQSDDGVSEQLLVEAMLNAQKMGKKLLYVSDHNWEAEGCPPYIGTGDVCPSIEITKVETSENRFETVFVGDETIGDLRYRLNTLDTTNVIVILDISVGGLLRSEKSIRMIFDWIGHNNLPNIFAPNYSWGNIFDVLNYKVYEHILNGVDSIVLSIGAMSPVELSNLIKIWEGDLVGRLPSWICSDHCVNSVFDNYSDFEDMNKWLPGHKFKVGEKISPFHTFNVLHSIINCGATVSLTLSKRGWEVRAMRMKGFERLYRTGESPRFLDRNDSFLRPLNQ